MPVLASAPEETQRVPLPQLFPPPERTVPRMLQLQAERHGPRRLVSIVVRALPEATNEGDPRAKGR